MHCGKFFFVLQLSFIYTALPSTVICACGCSHKHSWKLMKVLCKLKR